MATKTLTVWPFSNVTNFQGIGQSLDALAVADGWTKVGDSTFDACLNADNDGKYISQTTVTQSLFFFFQNDGLGGGVPAGSTINSVKFQVRTRNTGGSMNIRLADAQGFYYQLGANGAFGQVNVDLATAPADPVTVAAFTTYETAALATNPVTSVAWLISDLLANQPNNADATLTGGYWQWAYGFITATSTDIDSFFLVVDYTPPAQTYNIDLPALAVIAATGGFPPDPIVGGVNSGGVGDSIYVAGGPNPSVTVSVPGYPGGLPYGRPGGYPVGVGTPPSQGPGSYASDLNQWRLERFDFQVRHEEHKG